MFERYNASTIAHGTIPPLSEPTEDKTEPKEEPSDGATSTELALRKPSAAPPKRRAFIGRMGTDESSGSSLPNAWFGSTPGHPFWLLPLEYVTNNIDNGMSPEGLTGPGALYNLVDKYRNDFDSGRDNRMDDYYAHAPWRHLFKEATKLNSTPPPQSLTILPFWEVYPYSWERDGSMYRHTCWVLDAKFNAARCKLLLGLDHRKSHSITYWSHSWSGDGDGHYDKGMEHISDPNKKGEGEGDKSDAEVKASMWAKQAEEADRKKGNQQGRRRRRR